MRKTFTLILALALALSLTACANNKAETKEAELKSDPTESPKSTTETTEESNPSGDDTPASKYKNPTEFSYSISDTDIKITFWELGTFSETIHPADGKPIEGTTFGAREWIIPYSIEITSGTSKSLTASIAALVTNNAAAGAKPGITVLFFERGTVTKTDTELTKNGYLKISADEGIAALTAKSLLFDENGNLSPRQVQIEIIVAAGPTSATRADVPYRRFTPISEKDVSVADISSFPITLGFMYDTLGETVANKAITWY